MNEQIIKRLRDAGGWLPLVGDTGTNLHLDAAKEIEKLQAEVERSSGELKYLDQYNAKLKQENDRLANERDKLKAEAKRLDAAVGEEISNRDRVEAHADRLADGIAKALGVDIGEHSSANCPWNNAFFAIDEFDLAAHDAEVIERALDHLERKATAEGFFTIDPFWLNEYAAQLRQQTKEVQS